MTSEPGRSASFLRMDSGRAVLQQAAGGGRRGGWALVKAQLQGGAPWGFTLQGGLEHGEPLIISKVEEGGKADTLECPLQVGDEIIIINDIDLTGYRQEAIALVKGSFKTLQITVRREFDPGYIEEFGSSPASYPSSFRASSPPLSSTTPPPPQHQQKTTHLSRPCSTGGVQLRIKNSASTTDLSGPFESDGGYLRKSPDQYSSRGSMESLDPPQSAHLQHQHTLGHHTHSGAHPAYSSCQQLSSARSSNSIDHLHSKRDSAYSSFSTSSSIPEYLASAPTFSAERSYSLETVPQRGGSSEMQQADIRYIRTLYNAQQGLSQEQELRSPLSLHSSDSRSGEGAKGGHSRDLPSKVPCSGGVCYRGSSNSSGASSSGVLAGTSHSSYENLKGAPAPPRRSDSFAAIKNHERPNSWSSVEQPRVVNRSLQKGSYHHSSGSVASCAAKGSCITEGQLHTVIEKSPESSPITKPRQGFPPPGSPFEPATSLTSPAPQSGCLILPTGVYLVPQPEPHYAQMPSSSPMLSTSGVYPALAKDSNRQQQKVRGQEDEATEQLRDGKLPSIEKGHQMNNLSPYPHSTIPTVSTKQSRVHESERKQLEDNNFGLNRNFLAAERAENQAGVNMIHNQQGPPAPSPHHHMHSNHGPHNNMLQEQDVLNPQTQSTVALGPQTFQERRDPYTTVQSGDHVRRLVDQSNVHPEPMLYSRVAQGQVPPSHPAVQPQHSSTTSLGHHSDSAALHYHHSDQKEQNRDKEHPLTRLENALVEVQRSTSPSSVVSASSHDNNTLGEGIQGPTRSLSVLERVSRFEHSDRAGKQRSQSISHGPHKNSFRRMTDKSYGGPCGAEDLRSMLERSTKAHRTMSYRGGSVNYKKEGTAPDPSSALERSLSSLHLDGSREENENKNSWKQDVNNMSSTLQDTSFHRSYRDSLKEAQSKVLHSTSLRQNSSTVHSSHAVSSPNSSSHGSHQPLPFVCDHPPSEKKGPKTMPKPVGVFTNASVTSAHTPKERHVVGPETQGPIPPALPRVAPVGPPALMRIGGRKRLSTDQKKHSYSEPDNMNEVGISDSENGLFKLGGETSVADRRKMFELGFANNTISRPDLRQLQQDAVAQYVQRKRSAKKDEGRERSGPRPFSAYLQSDNTYHSDTISLSSTSSLLSLQDSGLDRCLSSSERRHFSSPGADLRSLQSNLYYPGRVTTPRAPSYSSPRGDPAPECHTSITHLPQNFIQEASSNKQNSIWSKEMQQTARPRQKRLGSKQATGSPAMVGSILGSGKSASVEDLLERSEERIPNHSRSRSSPTLERLNQGSASDQVKMFDAFVPEPERWTKTEGSIGDNKPLEGLASPAGSSLGTAFSHSPVPPRDRQQRQRNSERQRAHSMSSLAASVGLPCPLSSVSGSQDGDGPDWQSSKGQSQANLDNITFPGTPHSNIAESFGGAVSLDGHLDTFAMDKPARHSLSDASISHDTSTNGIHGERTFSLERNGGHYEENIKPVSSVTTSPLLNFQFASTPDKKHSGNVESRPSTPSHQSLLQNLPSPMSLNSSTDQKQISVTSTGLFNEDMDEVFLLNPAPPSPSRSIIETNIMGDFPLPRTPPLELDKKNSLQIAESLVVPSSRPRSSTLASTSSSNLQLDDTLNLEYQPLLKREKTVEELQVEMLAKQLLVKDRSLTHILETWKGKSPVDLVEEIFQNGRLDGKVPWQARGSPLNDRSENVLNAAVDERTKMEEKDLNSSKVELCKALRCSVVAMHQEKDALCEEQKRHQALGASIGSLVHKLCKINERDKYNMFIGDLEKIVNLLLSLCSRLWRIDKSLFVLQQQELTKEDISEERDSLNHKRSQLLSQTEDAWELKQNLDRRQRVVHAILRGYLTDAQLQDYLHFVSTKPSLLIRQRNLDDLIRQREEQLTRLAETLPPELAAARDWSRGSFRASSNPVSCSFPCPPPIPGHTHSGRSTTVTSL
nr:protein Shroom3 isoform X4 [Syngnathus scovelli]